MKENKYIDQFNKIFDLETVEKIKNNKLSTLERIYTYIEEDLSTLNNETLKLTKEAGDILDRLDKTFTDEQKELYEEYYERRSEIEAEENRQLFMYGYILAYRLKEEIEQN